MVLADKETVESAGDISGGLGVCDFVCVDWTRAVRVDCYNVRLWECLGNGGTLWMMVSSGGEKRWKKVRSESTF